MTAKFFALNKRTNKKIKSFDFFFERSEKSVNIELRAQAPFHLFVINPKAFSVTWKLHCGQNRLHFLGINPEGIDKLPVT